MILFDRRHNQVVVVSAQQDIRRYKKGLVREGNTLFWVKQGEFPEKIRGIEGDDILHAVQCLQICNAATVTDRLKQLVSIIDQEAMSITASVAVHL
jgi:hypothetical protein